MELVAIGLMIAFRHTMAYKCNCGATRRPSKAVLLISAERSEAANNGLHGKDVI
jgi:hypothetical protein